MQINAPLPPPDEALQRIHARRQVVMRKSRNPRRPQDDRQEKVPGRGGAERFSAGERHATIVENADAVREDAGNGERERRDAERMLDGAMLPHR